MPRIELTQSEADTLRQVLESYLSDLRVQISATDLKDFRDELRETRKVLEDIVERLDAAA